MDDQKQKQDISSELGKIFADLKKNRQASNIQAKVLITKANQLADELEKTDFSDLDDAEKKAMKDLNTATAEEITSLELEEEEVSE